MPDETAGFGGIQRGKGWLNPQMMNPLEAKKDTAQKRASPWDSLAKRGSEERSMRK